MSNTTKTTEIETIAASQNAAIEASRQAKSQMLLRAEEVKNNRGEQASTDTNKKARAAAAKVLASVSPRPLHYKELGEIAVNQFGYRGTQGTPPSSTLYVACKEEAEHKSGSVFAFYRGGVFGLLKDAMHHTDEAIANAKPGRNGGGGGREFSEVSLEDLLAM